jgi:hypothetical protein
MALWCNWEFGFVNSPALLFFLKIALAVWGLLCIHMNFSVDFCLSVKNVNEILMEIASNL